MGAVSVAQRSTIFERLVSVQTLSDVCRYEGNGEAMKTQPRDLVYDPFSYDIHEDPYPVYARLRDEAPAYLDETHGFWALSRYDDVRAALLDHETYCSGQGFTLEDIGDFALPMLLGMDPPDHTRLRSTVNRALTPRRMADLEAAVRDLACKLISEFAPRGSADLISELAALLPMAVISRMLGVPDLDQNELRRLSDEMVHREDGAKGVPEKGKAAAVEIYSYFEQLLGARDDRDGDDLLTLLLAAEQRGEISHAEVLGFCFLLIIAGNETTTKLIGNMAYQLSRYPEQKARLAADRRLVSRAIEEVLRFDPSTHMMARTLTRDVELHGCTLQRGRKVALILASANRDERRWCDPDRFDVARDASDHVAFGFGIHHCLGAALARLEARVAFEEIFARLIDFDVEDAGLVRMHSGNVRGFSRVPIRFAPAA
jgi:cytochrome P450